MHRVSPAVTANVRVAPPPRLRSRRPPRQPKSINHRRPNVQRQFKLLEAQRVPAPCNESLQCGCQRTKTFGASSSQSATHPANQSTNRPKIRSPIQSNRRRDGVGSVAEQPPELQPRLHSKHHRARPSRHRPTLSIQSFLQAKAMKLVPHQHLSRILHPAGRRSGTESAAGASFPVNAKRQCPSGADSRHRPIRPCRTPETCFLTGIAQLPTIWRP